MEENNVETLTSYDVSINLLSDLYQRYFDSEDPAEKAKLCNQILACLDRISKMDDTFMAQKKCEMDNETKLEMNRLDNKTKLEMCKLEKEAKIEVESIHKRTEDAKMAIQGCSTVLDILKAGCIGMGGIILTGVALDEEKNGFTGGRSLAYRLATDLARKVKL